MAKKDRKDWMNRSPVDMSAERDLVSRIEEWAQQAGWRVVPDQELEHSLRTHTDAVIDTGRGLIVIEAKRKALKGPGRIDVKTYPAGDRVYLIESAPGQWRFLTESNTYDQRAVNAEGLRSLVEEMLRIA